MIFNTLNDTERKLQYLMAKESSPIGKFLIQQNLVASRLMRLIRHLSKESVKGLEKATLGRLTTMTDDVLSPNDRHVFIPVLNSYCKKRNEIVHNLEVAHDIMTWGKNELYHHIKEAKKDGNIVLGKTETLFRKYQI